MPRRVDSTPALTVVAAKLDAPLIARLRSAAREHDRSLSGEIRNILKKWAADSGGDDGR